MDASVPPMRQETTQYDNDPRVGLAIQRTELAQNRTLLSWIRTALGLMAAGVAFDKGARLLHEARLAAGTAWVRSGHLGGLMLTGLSILLLTIVTWDYVSSVRTLAGMRGSLPPRFTPALVASGVVILMGFAAFTILIFSP